MQYQRVHVGCHQIYITDFSDNIKRGISGKRHGKFNEKYMGNGGFFPQADCGKMVLMKEVVQCVAVIFFSQATANRLHCRSVMSSNQGGGTLLESVNEYRTSSPPGNVT